MQQKEREKTAIIEIVKNSKCYDYNDMEQVKQVLSVFKGKEELCMSEFGRRYIERLKKVAEGTKKKELCILCSRNESQDYVVCSECLDNISTIDGDISYEKQMENMQYYLAKQMRMETRLSTRYTDDIVRNLDSTMDRLATQSSIKATNRMVAVTLAFCCINTFCIIGIFILLLLR